MGQIFSTFMVAAASLGFAAQANAATFSVSSAVSDELHGVSQPHNHAIWLPFFENVPHSPLFGNSEGSDFDFMPDGVFEVRADGSATLSGNIVSQVDSNYTLDVIFEFVGLAGPGSGGPKRELRNCAYGGSCGDIDPSTWDYFQMTGGTLTGTGFLDGIVFSASERPDNSVFPLQMGEGANNKNGNLGLSAWFYLALIGDCTNKLCDDIASMSLVGDINVDILETPLPAGFALFGTGLAGLIAARRRKRAA